MIIRYFAAIRAAVGTAEETLAPPTQAESDADSASWATLGDIIDEISRRHNDARTPRGTSLDQLLHQASFLLDGQRYSAEDRATSVDGVEQIDILPPFAGG